MKKNPDFYDLPKWRRLKDRVMIRDKYIDQLQLRYSPFPVQAQIVHHIFPREWFPEYQFEEWNLISISKSTHNQLHDRDTNRLTDKGMNLLIRTAHKRRMNLTEELQKYENKW